jgi:hypothetical protein
MKRMPLPSAHHRRSRRPRLGLLAALITACSSSKSDVPTGPVPPVTPGGSGANMRIASVQLTQATQDQQGSLPLISGVAAAVNVLIERSRDSAVNAPVVLRLFRSGALIRTDTARTRGVLGATSNFASPSAQFLLPATVVSGNLSWQVQIDPAQTVPDSIRGDNTFPDTGTTSVAVIDLPQLEVHFVPIIVAAPGNVTTANLDAYLQTARELLPVGPISATIGTPIATANFFGTPPSGGAPAFWTSTLAELDLARIMSARPTEHWYGVVAPPAGFSNVTNGGWAYIPADPASAAANTRTALGVNVGWFNAPTQSRELVAHELGHTFGRRHNTSCGGGNPLDTSFPNATGATQAIGHDVQSWARGENNAAPSIAASTFDIMGLCTRPWIGPYTWNAVRLSRQASAVVTTRTARVPAILVAGVISADGAVSLRPALEAEVTMPAATAAGDVTVELRDVNGLLLASRTAVATDVDHANGEKHFVAILPSGAAAAAARIVATTREGRAASISASASDDTVSATLLSTGMTTLRSARGRALLVRDAQSGEMLAIGWHGTATVAVAQPIIVSTSNGVRAKRITVALR